MTANELFEGAAPDIQSSEASKRPRARRRGTASSTAALPEIERPDARVAAMIRAVTRRIAARPLTAVGAALGVGFLVGGGLSFRAGRIALAVAGRRVVREVLKQIL